MSIDRFIYADQTEKHEPHTESGAGTMFERVPGVPTVDGRLAIQCADRQWRPAIMVCKHVFVHGAAIAEMDEIDLPDFKVHYVYVRSARTARNFRRVNCCPCASLVSWEVVLKHPPDAHSEKWHSFCHFPVLDL